MSDESSTRRNNALDFLDELDERHDFLLDELEQLNVRIDLVLNEYTKSRQTAAHTASLAGGIATALPTEVDAATSASNDQIEAVDLD